MRKDDLIGFRDRKVVFEMGSHAYQATVDIAKTASGQKRLHDILKMGEIDVKKKIRLMGLRKNVEHPQTPNLFLTSA